MDEWPESPVTMATAVIVINVSYVGLAANLKKIRLNRWQSEEQMKGEKLL